MIVDFFGGKKKKEGGQTNGLVQTFRVLKNAELIGCLRLARQKGDFFSNQFCYRSLVLYSKNVKKRKVYFNIKMMEEMNCLSFVRI